jgi:hypothetical protein
MTSMTDNQNNFNNNGMHQQNDDILQQHVDLNYNSYINSNVGNHVMETQAASTTDINQSYNVNGLPCNDHQDVNGAGGYTHVTYPQQQVNLNDFSQGDYTGRNKQLLDKNADSIPITDNQNCDDNDLAGS